jgi:hypothetical protein
MITELAIIAIIVVAVVVGTVALVAMGIRRFRFNTQIENKSKSKSCTIEHEADERRH